MKTVADAKPGFDGVIVELSGEKALVERLAELGLTPGYPIKVVGRVAFGEPLLVEARGASIALRLSEAVCIRI